MPEIIPEIWAVMKGLAFVLQLMGVVGVVGSVLAMLMTVTDALVEGKH